MNPYISFLMEHWIAASGFVIILLILVINEWRHRAFGVQGITPQQLVEILNHANGVVLDVRAKEQFEKGSVLNAINIPYDDVKNQLNTLSKYKTKPVIVVCQKGLSAPKTANLLKNEGFTQVYYLEGGIEVWQSNGMPIFKK